MTAVVKIQVSAVNSVGEGSKTANLDDHMLASAATDLTISSIGANASARDLFVSYAISGGQPPYSAKAYFGTAATMTKAAALSTVSNALPGFVATTNTQGKNVLLVVTDAAKTSVSSQFAVNSLGSYAPGDMSDFIDGWIANQDTLYISRPLAMHRLFLAGSIPANVGDTSTVHAVMVEGQAKLFNSKDSLEIQGQTSVGADAKGYKIRLTNKDTGNKFQMKFGNWPASSTFDLKSYGYTDDTGYSG